jgi:SAM-dependent methyltransferase
MAATTGTGSATRWGPLWGARPADWAVSEEQQTPSYEAALKLVEIGPGSAVLDVGCGAGVFLRIVADRHMGAFGVDASEALVELARTRVPEADIRVGEMESLPYEDDTFDLVSGFTSFFFAEDMVGALREAGRVAKPGAPVLIQVWGPAEDNELEAMKEVMRSFLPPPPADAPSGAELWREGVLEGMATEAGLSPESTFDHRWAYEYRGEDALGRAMMAPAGLAALVGPDREPEVRERIVEALAPFRTAGGDYLLQNGFHFLIARA